MDLACLHSGVCVCVLVVLCACVCVCAKPYRKSLQAATQEPNQFSSRRLNRHRERKPPLKMWQQD